MAEAAKVEVKIEPAATKPGPAKPEASVVAKVAEQPVVAARITAPPATKAPIVKSPVVKKTPKAAVIKKPATVVKKTVAAKPAVSRKTVAKKVAVGVTTPVSSPLDLMKVKAMNMNDTMKKQAETTMNQGKAAVDQIQTKARVAMEQGSKSMEEINILARGNVEALVEAGRVAAKGFETMTKSAIELTKKNAEATTAAVRSFASAKNANELVQLQSDFARSQFDKMVADGSKMTEMFVKLAGEMFEPISNRFAVAADRFAKVGAR